MVAPPAKWPAPGPALSCCAGHGGRPTVVIAEANQSGAGALDAMIMDCLIASLLAMTEQKLWPY
jgi:hypothetical protein